MVARLRVITYTGITKRVGAARRGGIQNELVPNGTSVRYSGSMGSLSTRLAEKCGGPEAVSPMLTPRERVLAR
jgi:hypothetical protein